MDKEQWKLWDERGWGKEEVQMLVWLGTTATHVLCLLHLSVSPGSILGAAKAFSWYHLPLKKKEFVLLPSSSRTASHPSCIRPTTLLYASSHILEVVHRPSPVLTFPAHLTPAGDRQWPEALFSQQVPITTLVLSHAKPAMTSKKTSCPDSNLTLPFHGTGNMDTYHWTTKLEIYGLQAAGRSPKCW